VKRIAHTRVLGIRTLLMVGTNFFGEAEKIASP
jgi:hypothetical protein